MAKRIPGLLGTSLLAVALTASIGLSACASNESSTESSQNQQNESSSTSTEAKEAPAHFLSKVDYKTDNVLYQVDYSYDAQGNLTTATTTFNLDSVNSVTEETYTYTDKGYFATRKTTSNGAVAIDYTYEEPTTSNDDDGTSITYPFTISDPVSNSVKGEAQYMVNEAGDAILEFAETFMTEGTGEDDPSLTMETIYTYNDQAMINLITISQTIGDESETDTAAAMDYHDGVVDISSYGTVLRWTLTYDEDGCLISAEDENGNTVTFTYTEIEGANAFAQALAATRPGQTLWTLAGIASQGTIVENDIVDETVVETN